MRDPFPQVDGGGFERLRAAGIVVDRSTEELERASRVLNAPYLKRLATGMPYVILKWAMTLDGKTAATNGDSRWITNERSRAEVHETRGRVDAMICGIGTVLADDPDLSARPAGPRKAIRVVLDGQARLPLDCRLARTAREIPVWVAADEQAPLERVSSLERMGCRVVRLSGGRPATLISLLKLLASEGATNVLVEGGGTVSGSFIDADLVDEVVAYIAPTIEGGSHGYGPVRGKGVEFMNRVRRCERVEIASLDGDLRIRGRVAREWLKTDGSNVRGG